MRFFFPDSIFQSSARALVAGGVMTALLLGASATLSAQSLAARYYDPAGNTTGAIHAALTQAPDGNLYVGSPELNGVIFRINVEGELTVAYNFHELSASDTNVEGNTPIGRLLVGHDGNLYGLTTQGGVQAHGTVYRLNLADGTVVPVASLAITPKKLGDSAADSQTLVQDQAGNFYYVGQNPDDYMHETIVKVTPSGDVSPLHVFISPDSTGKNSDGSYFACGLVIDGQDNMYGFTNGGGAGRGTFFRVTPGGGFTVLYTYDADYYADNIPAPAIGSNPIVVTSDGTVYGAGAPKANLPEGGIFMARNGAPTVIHDFGSSYGTGVSPEGLTLGSDGVLYGSTTGGGDSTGGTIFQITPGGSFTSLYSFPSNAYTFEPPVRADNGDLYGHCYGDLGGYYRLGATLLPVFNAPTQTLTATQGVQISYQLMAVNDPDTYAASGLPAGLTLDAKTGLITGATTAVLGDYPVTLTATNSDGNSTATLTITVQAPSPDLPVINVPSAPLSAEVGVPFDYQIDATNKPTSYQIKDLPDGVTVDPKTGLVHGLFANAGKILLIIQAQNASGAGSASLEIDVAPANTLPVVTAVVSADANAATGQAGAFTISLSVAPTAKLIVSYSVKGSAVNGGDYALLNGAVKFKAGKTSKQVVITPLRDTGGPGKKTVKLTLQPGSGYTVGTAAPVKVKIAE